MKLFKTSLLLIFLSLLVFLFKISSVTKNIYAQGTCSCETATSCVVTSSNNNCEGGYIPYCSGGYCPYPGACSCVTPTPVPIYSCHWSDFGLGECRLSDDSACRAAGCYGDCSRYGSDNCQSTHPCICSTPTPALPTEYQDCQDQCVNPTYPVGNCLDTQGNDPPGCVNPPGSNNYDCTANGLDCLCCTELLEGVTPREELNVFCGANSINTAIGCLPVGDKNTFLVFLLRWAIGISGGVSFILIIYSGFMIMTSGGDKRRLQSGKELLTAALSGLILIVFSVFILDLIGIRILKIPGL